MDTTIKRILLVLVLLFGLASADLMAFPGSKETAEIFDCARTILPLLAGIVLGFYFGRVSQ